MDLKLYKAAESGNWDVIKEFADHFNSQQTPKGNTVLHVLAQSCDSSDAAKQILAKTPDLVLKTNAYLETPLHMAARHGHSHVVRALIDHARGNEFGRLEDVLGTGNNNGNTALHEAVRNNCYEAVKMLVEAAPNFQYQENFAGESPLYLAVEKAHLNIADLILKTCTSPSYLGPGKRTAMHIAAARNFPGCLNAILKKLPNLVKEVDEVGWTSLHYAARFNHKEVLKLLLTTDNSLAYLPAQGDESKTALHVAVTHGHLDVIKEILSYCPDCWEMTTENFQNMFHLAAESEQTKVLKFISKKRWVWELINQKDVFGETTLRHDIFIKEMEAFNLKNTMISAGLNLADIMRPQGDLVTERDEVTGRDEVAEREMETEMVVAALIVTVTFAAGFTIPGGYDTSKGNEGMAVLSKKSAFIVFVVSDSLALLASVSSVFLQFLVKNKVHLFPKSDQLLIAAILLRVSDLLRNPKYAIRYQISVSLMLMLIAFLTGLYAVLPNRAIKTYLIVYGSIICCPIFLYFLVNFVLFAQRTARVNYRFKELLSSRIRTRFDDARAFNSII